jgi:hypothetical protein
LTISAGLENYSMALFGSAGWDEANIRALLDKVRAEIADPGLKGYGKV